MMGDVSARTRIRQRAGLLAALVGISSAALRIPELAFASGLVLALCLIDIVFEDFDD